MAPVKTPNAPRGTIKGTASNDLVKFTIRASPLPEAILRFILDNILTLKRLQHERKTGEAITEDLDGIDEEEGANLQGDLIRSPSVKAGQFWEVLDEICKSARGEWEDISERIWSFGPQRAGGCLLIDARKNPSQSYAFTFCQALIL